MKKKLLSASRIHPNVAIIRARSIAACALALLVMSIANPSLSGWARVGTTAAAAATPLAAFTLPDGIPDFSQDASRPGVQSAKSGRWGDPATWGGGQVPTANHVVRVLQGHIVTVDDTTATAYNVVIDGTLSFAPTVNTRLKATTVEVMAGNNGDGTPGVLEIGTTAAPIAAGAIAEIVISNTSIGGSVADPDQFGTGVLVFGTITMNGSAKTPTFVRVSTEPRAGNMTLALSEAVSGWRAGDRLVFPIRGTSRKVKSPAAGGSTPSTSGKSAPCRRSPPMALP